MNEWRYKNDGISSCFYFNWIPQEAS
uniref:Uncharacterized protein n=1 Tax=Nelumbo nucifera TaxID=4432 RepID=A0A822Z8X0_NELNU|nr:TPA_asm: hypothetical protein HUJ06_015815 [Nelumbo nucifera]